MGEFVGMCDVLARARCASTLCLLLLLPGTVAAQPVSTSTVVDRTTAYVHAFFTRFTNVVAEERYVQTVSADWAGRGPRRRVLVSDFLLVQAPGSQGSNEWYQFRDVREVDGKAVTDRERRLTELFLQPWDTSTKPGARITADAARHNLVSVGTINYPLLALAILQPRYRERLDFSLGGLERAGSQQVRVISFREKDVRETILDRMLRSVGRAWVEEATGRVMKTELDVRTATRKFADRITTSFVFDERLQLAVPAEMRDSYVAPNMSGVATYGQFRTFQVRTEEEVRP